MPALHGKLHAVDEKTPERIELDHAIERHRAAFLREDARANAEARAYGDIMNAREAVATAKANVEQARAASVQRRIDQAMGKPGDEPSPVQAARDALTVAEETLHDANAAKSALVMQSGELNQMVELAAMKVREAVRNVIKSEPATQSLIDDYMVGSDLCRCPRDPDLPHSGGSFARQRQRLGGGTELRRPHRGAGLARLRQGALHRSRRAMARRNQTLGGN